MESKIKRNAENVLSTMLSFIIGLGVAGGVLWCVLSFSLNKDILVPIVVTIVTVVNALIWKFFVDIISNISYKLDRDEDANALFHAQMMIGDKEKAKEMLAEWISKDEDFKSLIGENDSVHDLASEKELRDERIERKYKKYFEMLGLMLNIETVKNISKTN